MTVLLRQPLPALPRVAAVLARALEPRKPVTVSEWAANDRILSSKTSGISGRWRNDRNPLLVEPMDCMSRHSGVHEVVIIFPIQFGKTEIELNVIGCTMDVNPCPIMVTLPDDITMGAWIEQKFNPMIESTPAVKRALTSTASRNASNQKAFKDFLGGQIFIEHAKTATRLTLKSICVNLVDELDKFAAALGAGEDPLELIKGRDSAFPSTYKRCFIGTPGLKGVSRLDSLWEASDQRRYYVPCLHCGEAQPFAWSGLHWSPDGHECWYVCRECGVAIGEHEKTEMIARGRWVPENPGAKIRGYHANCLYYPIGLGPRWIDLVGLWRAAQLDPAKLQVFVQERLAESWEDPKMRAVKHRAIADRAEPLPLRPLPPWVLAATAGIDTQDDRLAVQIVGWGPGLRCWPIDYVELPGDPADEAVFTALIDLLLRPIESSLGGHLRIEAAAIDIMGHRTEAVKSFVRRGVVRRLLAIFGAVPNNAPVLGKGKLQDINWRGQLDKRGVHIHAVGTVGIKHLLYSRLSADADKDLEHRWLRFSHELPDEYFGGLVAEIYNPAKNRFEKRRGAPRNEPLDTWVYAYAATHHPELRLHRRTKLEWEAAAERLTRKSEPPASASAPPSPATRTNVPRETLVQDVDDGFGSSEWSRRL